MTPATLRTAADVLDQLVDRERHAAVADALRVLAQRGEVSARDLVVHVHGDGSCVAYGLRWTVRGRVHARHRPPRGHSASWRLVDADASGRAGRMA